MIPDVGAAGAGVVVHAEDRAEPVILEAGGEDVGGAVAERVGDEDDRALIDLADVVAAAGSVSGKPCEKPAPVESAISSGCSHSSASDSVSASRRVSGGRHEVERLGRDRRGLSVCRMRSPKLT